MNFLTFTPDDELPPSPREGPRTAQYTVTLTRTGETLGTVRWHVAWRQYVFIPTPGAQFNARCLDEICAQLVALMDAWARERGRDPNQGAGKFGAPAPQPGRATIGRTGPPVCPHCGRIMSEREQREQGACNDCRSGQSRP
jgi:hypothetical protein